MNKIWKFCFCCFCLAACGGNSWYRYESSLCHTMEDPSIEAREQHGQLLAKIIEEAQEKGAKPPPGICAEYAYYLVELKKDGQGMQYLDREIAYYPESTTYIIALRRLLQGAKNVVHESPETKAKK